MASGLNTLVVYGPNSNALSDYLANLPASLPVIRIFGSRRPLEREGCIDIGSIAELGGALTTVRGRLSDPMRIGVIGAAVVSQASLLASETDESIEQQLQTNVSSYVALVRSCLPFMISARYGRFIYLSSFRSHQPTAGTSVYAASKAFGESFFRSVGVEYGRLGITATTIRMGYFDGGLLADFDADRLSETTKHVSLRRLGQPSDLSRAIAFAFDSEMSNGGVIELDGGLDFG